VAVAQQVAASKAMISGRMGGRGQPVCTTSA
jgi:hypothetical protein